MLDDASKPQGPDYRHAEGVSTAGRPGPARRNTRNAPSVHHVNVSGLRLSYVNGRPAPGRGLHTAPFQQGVKRIFDVIAGLLAIVLLSPAFLVVALAIKMTSPGPVFFAHKRAGCHGVPIQVLKFRSMHHRHCDAESCAQTILDDPRITPVGNFLRRTSLDELPQLINVLKGDMSLVGPRPHAIDMQAAGASYRMLVPHYGARHSVRPGITGWAQANGLRGEINTADAAMARVEHDIAYIQNFSLLLDLRILAKTIICEFLSGSGR